MARFGNEKRATELYSVPTDVRVVRAGSEWVVQGWMRDGDGWGWDLIDVYPHKATADAHRAALRDDLREMGIVR